MCPASGLRLSISPHKLCSIGTAFTQSCRHRRGDETASARNHDFHRGAMKEQRLPASRSIREILSPRISRMNLRDGHKSGQQFPSSWAAPSRYVVVEINNVPLRHQRQSTVVHCTILLPSTLDSNHLAAISCSLRHSTRLLSKKIHGVRGFIRSLSFACLLQVLVGAFVFRSHSTRRLCSSSRESFGFPFLLND